MRSAIIVAFAASGAIALCPIHAHADGADGGRQAVQRRVQQERAACHAEAQAAGTPASAMPESVIGCLAKTDPMAARRMACAVSARARGVQQPDLPMAVHTCMNVVP